MFLSSQAFCLLSASPLSKISFPSSSSHDAPRIKAAFPNSPLFFLFKLHLGNLILATWTDRPFFAKKEALMCPSPNQENEFLVFLRRHFFFLTSEFLGSFGSSWPRSCHSSKEGKKNLDPRWIPLHLFLSCNSVGPPTVWQTESVVQTKIPLSSFYHKKLPREWDLVGKIVTENKCSLWENF